MRHTPEELLGYLDSDPAMRFGAINALSNNDRGFGYCNVDAGSIELDHGRACARVTLGMTGETIEISLGDGLGRLGEMLESAGPSRCRAAIVFCGDCFSLVVASADGDGDPAEALMDRLLLEFFSETGIGTIGQLRAAAEKGWEILDRETASGGWLGWEP